MGFKYADVQKEYEKHETLKKEDILALQNWMEKQKHLPKISELKIIFFFQSCGFRLEPTKICIENYFTIRSKCPEFFTNRTYEAIKFSLESVLVAVLPLNTAAGECVTVLKLLNSNPEKFHFSTHVKAIDMVITLNTMINGTAKGQVMVLDMEGAKLSHILKINLMEMKKYIIYLQEALHANITAVHITNATSLTDRLLTMVKPFIKSELFDSIHVHTKYDTLYEYVNKDILPKEFGGNGDSFQTLQEKTIQMVKENEEYFSYESLEMIDESKRQGSPVNVEGLFGIDGSFKKLDID